jgi:hypothetical protein
MGTLGPFARPFAKLETSYLQFGIAVETLKSFHTLISPFGGTPCTGEAVLIKVARKRSRFAGCSPDSECEKADTLMLGALPSLRARNARAQCSSK